MDYKKYIEYLEKKFEQSIAFSKEVALKRDNKLISGFIYKAEEEISFNDFYSFGNENILKYSGVLAGLEEKNYEFFKDMPMEMAWKMHEIDKMSSKIISEYPDYEELYNKFKLGAEYCLYIYIEDSFKYKKLDNRLVYNNLLTKASNIALENDVSLNKIHEFKKIIQTGEVLMENIKMIDSRLESKLYLKKNALFATKNFNWLHEKGNLERMTNVELKAFYAKKVKEEIRNKHNFLQNDNADSSILNNKVIITA